MPFVSGATEDWHRLSSFTVGLHKSLVVLYASCTRNTPLFRVSRQMKVAAREEDYALASRLRDEMAPLSAQLHPMRQYLWGRVQALHCANSKQDRLDAIAALGASACCFSPGHRRRIGFEADLGTGVNWRRAKVAGLRPRFMMTG